MSYVEIDCLPCDTTGIKIPLEKWRQIRAIQEKEFSDEWKTEDICWKCCRDHQRDIGDGLYTEEECLEQEKELRERGYYPWRNGHWTDGCGVFPTYRFFNSVRLSKLNKK